MFCYTFQSCMSQFYNGHPQKTSSTCLSWKQSAVLKGLTVLLDYVVSLTGLGVLRYQSSYITFACPASQRNWWPYPFQPSEASLFLFNFYLKQEQGQQIVSLPPHTQNVRYIQQYNELEFLKHSSGHSSNTTALLKSQLN